jgi:organic radical activating enzyme
MQAETESRAQHEGAILTTKINKNLELADNNIIINKSLCEINVVHHCNLSCRGCTHLSPIWSKVFVDPKTLLADLRTLAGFYRAEKVGLMGGEPLLHPDILAVIGAVRGSGITCRVVIVTNGLLLWKMSDGFWDEVDEVRVSIYPGKRMTPKQLRICQRKAQRYNVSLKVSNYDRFRESYAELGTTDEGLIERIYNTCLLVHRWNCHTIDNHYFYKCPQSLFLSKLLGDKFPSPHIDGIQIVDSPTFSEELRAYLESPYPLASCKYCLGATGKIYQHEQVERSAFRQSQHARIEDLIDMDQLAVLEQDLDAGDINFGCGKDRYWLFLRKMKHMMKWGYRELARSLGLT